MPRPALNSRLRNLKQENPMNVNHYIGFDVHKKSVSYCVKLADGQIVEESRLRATHDALRQWAGKRPEPWHGAGLELRMELGCDEERVIVKLDHLHQALIGRGSRDAQTRALQAFAQKVVDLIAVAVALVDDGLAVDVPSERAVVELDRIGAQAHRSPEVGHLLLLGQQVYHGVGGLDVELGRVGTLHARHVPSELGHGALHAETYAQVGDLLLAGDLSGGDLPLDPSGTEAAGNEDAIGAGEELLHRRAPIRVRLGDLTVILSGVPPGRGGLKALGVDPVDLHLRVPQRGG